MMRHRFCIRLLILSFVSTAIWAADNVAPNGIITASVDPDEVGALVDGRVPSAGSRDDGGHVWVIKKNQTPATLTFTWPQPVTVSTVVYYGRTTWGFELFTEYELYLNDGKDPVAKGAFKVGHGPQPVHLPKPVQARKLSLKLLKHTGNNPGVAEVQIFSSKPSQDDFLCRFSDFSLDFRFAYYPSHNLIRALAPNPPGDAKTWELAVRPKGKDRVLAKRQGPLPMASVAENLPVSDLPDGHYILTLTLAGGDEPVIEERGFQRHRYEWEDQGLGMDDVVVPPFTPLTADADTGTVDCVLRTHTHAATGFWKQVVSQDKEILAGPIRVEAAVGGRTVTAQGDGVAFDEVKDTRVTGAAAWSAGPLRGQTGFAYDYDGFLQLTLTLQPTATPVDRLQLVIPLKKQFAWLLHPVTVQLRQHYAGRLPTGEGKVWDSGSVKSKVGGHFVPYLYLGGPERGVCFAADNDRDWIIDRDVPMMEIHREGNSVSLRLNLIAKRAKLNRKRTLRFALQATPAKPLPAKPYTWRHWWTTGTDKDAADVQIRFWGGNMYWGGRNFATSMYPDQKEFSYWEKLAEQRRTGKLDKEYLKEWLARFDELPPKRKQQVVPAVRAGFNWSSHTPMNTPETKKYNFVIPYTNPRGCSAEDRDFLTTYLDEWQTIDITAKNWPRINPFQRVKRMKGFGTWYHVEAVKSRVDMMLYYHQKMYETFADGIYWDNMFLRDSKVPEIAGGPGYIDDDGNLRPGVNLMAFRQLVRRNAVMMHVMGKRPLSYIHMTNTNIVPILSFGTLNLDWEWRDQGAFAHKDLQDRLRVDGDTSLILAQSLGRKSGNISVAIDRFHPPKNSRTTRDWLFRTVMAVCLPHEIKVYQGPKSVRFVQAQMVNFGYGRDDCEIYRYWDEDYPLQVGGANLFTLVMKRGKKIMLAIGNFGPENAAAEPRVGDAPALEDYDAGQRHGTPAPAAEGKIGDYETYPAVLKLHLKALGLPDTARAYDVEQRAGQAKAAPPGAKTKTQPPAANELKRLTPGVFELPILKHDFALIVVE